MRRLRPPPYWYRFYEEYCPVCGRTRVTRERVYHTLKPKTWTKRHLVTEAYDYCDVL